MDEENKEIEQVEESVKPKKSLGIYDKATTTYLTTKNYERLNKVRYGGIRVFKADIINDALDKWFEDENNKKRYDIK